MFDRVDREEINLDTWRFLIKFKNHSRLALKRKRMIPWHFCNHLSVAFSDGFLLFVIQRVAIKKN